MTIPNHYVWLYKDKTILYMVKYVEKKLEKKEEVCEVFFPLTCLSCRLTLLLSCAMHFENYPHDEQICHLSMESRKDKKINCYFCLYHQDGA